MTSDSKKDDEGGSLIRADIANDLLDMFLRQSPYVRNLPPVPVPLRKRLRYQLVLRPSRAISDIWAHIWGRNCSEVNEGFD